MKKKLEWAVVALFWPAGFLPIFFLPVCASGQASSPSAAIALEQQGKLAEAAQVWRAVIQKDPNDAGAFASLGVILSKQQNYHDVASALFWKSHLYDDAKREFESELSIDPSHPLALAYLGDIEMKRTNPDPALALLRRAVGVKNDIRIAYVDLGAVLTQQKQYKDAVTALRHAVELDPSQPDAHYRLGRTYQAMGNSAESQKEFAKVRELHEKADESLASRMSATPPPLPQ